MPAPAPKADQGAPARKHEAAFTPEMSVEDQRRAFLRLVSHELRTPLNSILGFSELLSAEILGPVGAPQYKEYAQIIQASGRRLLTLVNQVLEIGRLQGLKLELSAQPAVPALEEAAFGLTEEFAARNLRPTILAEGDPPACLADAWGLRTVLTHLIRNAIGFSPAGGEVRLRVQPAGAFVDLFVEDDGEGIDPADLPRLFLPFEQGGNALSRRGDGAGLGLTIADLTCQAMGARLTLAPGVAGGVSARVRLKAAPVAPEPAAA
jgi:signal transduction histidine kinase